MEKNDGGAAFPAHITMEGVTFENGDCITTTKVEGGMSLRDYFAAHINVDRLSLPDWTQEELAKMMGRDMPEDKVLRLHWRTELIAKLRYAEADAMVKEREK